MKIFARRLGAILMAAAGLMAVSHLPARAAVDSAVYVEIKESEDRTARVVERWKLYAKSHALVIGIDDYSNGWPRLSNAVKDAERVAAALTQRGFDVTLLKNLDSDELRTAIRHFFSLKGADEGARLFVWYSGHGFTERGEGYLVPADSPLPGDPSFLFSALHMRDFGGLVRLAKAKHAFAVFDSCFSGTIFSVQRSRPPAAITRATVKPVRQFLTSGDADQKVSDDGTFSRLFIEAIAGEARADANSDGYLTGSELSLHLEQRLTNLTEGQQTPRSGKLRDARFDGGDFVFLLPQRRDIETVKQAPKATAAVVVPPDPSTVAPSSPSDAAFDLAFWGSVKDSDRAADFQAYLEAFPNGRFAPLARLRADALDRKTTRPDTLAPSSQAQLEVQAEQAFWSSVKDSDDAASYEAYLAQYPDGVFAPLARARIAASSRRDQAPAVATRTAPTQRDSKTPEPAPSESPSTTEAAPAKPKAGSAEVQTALVTAPPEPKRAPPPKVVLEPIGKPYVALRNANVRAQPDKDAPKVSFLRKGTKITVQGKVRGSRWLALERQGSLLGYVYAPLMGEPKAEPKVAPTKVAKPAAAAPSRTQQAAVSAPRRIALQPIEAVYVAVKSASIRSEPRVDSSRVASLNRGGRIYVAGKVKDQDWLAVEADGRQIGYVYAPLLQPAAQAVEPAREAAAQPQTAARPDPAHPFDGEWRGTYTTNLSELPGCRGGRSVTMTIRNSGITGQLSLGGKAVRMSGKIGKDGQITKLWGSAPRTVATFKGAIAGGKMSGKFEIEKKSNSEYAGPVYCRGAFALTQ